MYISTSGLLSMQRILTQVYSLINSSANRAVRYASLTMSSVPPSLLYNVAHVARRLSTQTRGFEVKASDSFEIHGWSLLPCVTPECHRMRGLCVGTIRQNLLPCWLFCGLTCHGYYYFAQSNAYTLIHADPLAVRTPLRKSHLPCSHCHPRTI